MSKFAEVLPFVGRSFPLLLTYEVPAELAERIEVGSQVLVPLAGRTAAGYVVDLHDRTPQFPLRPIESVLEAEPAFTPRQLELARWIADYYCSSLAQALRPFLSEVGAVRVRRYLRLTVAGEALLDSLTGQSDEILAALRALRARKGRAGRAALAAAVGRKRLSAVLRSLKQQGLVEERGAITLLDQGQAYEVVSLAVELSVARQKAVELSARALRQAAVLHYLAGEEGAIDVPREVSLAEIALVAKGTAAARALAKKGLVKIRTLTRWRTPWPDAPTDQPPAPELTRAQRAAVNEITRAVKAGAPEDFLLFGVTGSGKTEIFLRTISAALARGQQALLLVPEISLTAQAVGLLRARFGESVAVIHSALSQGERRDEKERVRLGEAKVVLGPRSALFAPFVELGIIVVDEEHDAAYKQEQEPHYHARDAALKLAQIYRCPCLLASATPALESFYRARKGEYRLLRLEERPEGRALPEVHLLDLRGKSRRPEILLPELQEGLKACLEAGGQAILFLNRRGHSTYLFCPLCGFAFRCPHCQVALIYHTQGKVLRCHHCDYALNPPTLCPNCQGSNLRLAGFGTQKVSEELARLFPAAQVQRMDRDTTAGRGAHLRLISDFRAASTDVLVGTQMISKGLHFPGVTVVGVVAADLSLNVPDFRSAERTFQLLTHVAGRAGRGSEPGTVFIQTYNPESYPIQTASRHDYEAFYEEEITLREEAGYPPFAYLASVTVSAPNAQAAQQEAQRLAELVLAKKGEADLDLLGPSPAPLAKLRDRFRYHFLLRAREEGVLQQLLRPLQEEFSSRGKIHVIVDIDPVSFM